jgi:hypothetical protein
LELSAKDRLFVGMKKTEDGGASQLVGRIAEQATEWVIDEQQRAVWMHESEKFLGGVEQCGEMLEAQTDSLLG